jgi:hypothetical protein
MNIFAGALKRELKAARIRRLGVILYLYMNLFIYYYVKTGLFTA